jgi:hypothetical protein
LNHFQDEIEAARMAAINQEIKRVLTEVLLKVISLHEGYLTRFNGTCTYALRNTTMLVPFFLLAFLSFQVTDDLFDEIATKVMNENDSADECE